MPTRQNVPLGGEDGWAAGSLTRLRFPACAEALRRGGVTFLTEAFQQWGALTADNAVTAITQFEETRGGSTGRKLLLSVDYERRDTAPPTELFVKFSRDFDDPARDRGRTQMEFEVQFALLSHSVPLPIAVPATLFADYDPESGAGVLITERIGFGRNGIEPQYGKCLDYRMPQPVEHYRALLTSVAGLAGAHRGGRLPAALIDRFPRDIEAASVGERPPAKPGRLERQLQRYADFAADYHPLLPANIRDADFIGRLATDAPRFVEQEQAIWDVLSGTSDHIALCHWNANVDNAWFWRDAHDRLRCGLMDWGCASQMNIAMAIWGSLCSAEIDLWDHHLRHLLGAFAAEFRACGGPELCLDTLRDHIVLYAAIMGITWLLDVPAYLSAQLPEPASLNAGRFDPRIEKNETVRSRLQMFTNFLNLWETHQPAQILDAHTRQWT